MNWQLHKRFVFYTSAVEVGLNLFLQTSSSKPFKGLFSQVNKSTFITLSWDVNLCGGEHLSGLIIHKPDTTVS